MAAITCALFTTLTLLSGCERSKLPEAIWLETGTGPGQVVHPRAIAYSRRDDTFFVVDCMGRIQHLDHNGHYLNEWEMPEHIMDNPKADEMVPAGLTVGPDGNLYVPDTHYHRVIVFTPKGRELLRFGKAGRGHGEFTYPTDIEFDNNGRMFVAEYGDNDRIQVFDMRGKFLYAFGSFGEGNGQFMWPQDMVIVGNLLYIADSCNHRIDVFTTDGKWIRSMGSCGSKLGQFRFPYGMDMDPQGHLIVSEFGNNRVQMIDKDTGKGLAIWGGPGHGPGQLVYPWGVVVDKRNRIIIVDAGNDRLQVFEF